MHRWLVLLIAMMAGCSSTPTEGPASPDAPPDAAAQRIPWTLHDCSYHAALVPVPADAVAPLLPPGHAPVTPEQRGLPPSPGAGALLGLEAMVCRQGTRLNYTAGAMEFATHWVPVHLPEAAGDAAEGRIQWDTLVPDAPRRQWLADHGAPVHDGDAQTFDLLYVGHLNFRDGGFVMEGVGSAVWFGPTSQPYSLPASFLARQVDGTNATWSAQVVGRDVAYGPGNIENRGDPVVTRIVGEERAFAWIVRGDIDLTGWIEVTT